MAKQVIVQLTDDIDGGTADENVQFGIDGKDYEIDLSAKNATALRRALEKYIAAGRPAQAEPRRRGVKRASTPTPEYDKAAYREWAASKGYDIPTRGRQPRKYIDEFLGK